MSFTEPLSIYIENGGPKQKVKHGTAVTLWKNKVNSRTLLGIEEQEIYNLELSVNLTFSKIISCALNVIFILSVRNVILS